MNEEKNSEISRNKEDFGVEDIEEYERLLEKDKGKSAEENIEHTINRALPNLLLDFIAISVISIPIVLVFWLGIKAPPLAIVVTVFFSCLTVLTFLSLLESNNKMEKNKRHCFAGA